MRTFRGLEASASAPNMWLHFRIRPQADANRPCLDLFASTDSMPAALGIIQVLGKCPHSLQTAKESTWDVVADAVAAEARTAAVAG